MENENDNHHDDNDNNAFQLMMNLVEPYRDDLECNQGWDKARLLPCRL